MNFADISVNASTDQSLKEGASEVVARLQPQWGCPATYFKYKIFSDGLTNKLVGVYVEDKKQDMILVRVYGDNSELMINRNAEIRNMKLSHASGCGSAELYATFRNGIAYQYLSGSVLTYETVSNALVFPAIAKACAKLHSI